MVKSGLSFVEIILGCVLLLVVVLPLGLLLSQATFETQASIDESLASVYLTEVVDQVASMPYEWLPVTEDVLDLTSTRPKRLRLGRKATTLHLSPMRSNFTSRSLTIEELRDPRESLKIVRATVKYARSRGRSRTLDMVTYVGRGRRPRYVPKRR